VQDTTLIEGLRREGAEWAEEQLIELGAIVGSEEAIQWGTDANTFTPVLHTHDRYGHRIDEVSFHPAWHHLMRTSITVGTHALSWCAARPGAQVARTITPKGTA
jgi:putative acyl-CoA dehydrogenase